MSDTKAPENTFTLSSGYHMPKVGFGTFRSKPEVVKPAVKAALAAGYRHIDTAELYSNQAAIGEALTEVFTDSKSGIIRSDVFVTSKIQPAELNPTTLIANLRTTLAELQLEYLDLYLIHIPVICHRVDGNTRVLENPGFSFQDVWRAMESAVDAGLVRSIGVSNMVCQMLHDVLCYARIPPAVLQVERHPYFNQNALVAYCKAHNVQVTAYSSFGSPGMFSNRDSKQGRVRLLDHPTITALATKYNKGPAHILLRWSLDDGLIVLPMSTNPARVASNFDVFDFTLSEEDHASITALNRNERGFDQSWLGIPTLA